MAMGVWLLGGGTSSSSSGSSPLGREEKEKNRYIQLALDSSIVALIWSCKLPRKLYVSVSNNVLKSKLLGTSLCR